MYYVMAPDNVEDQFPYFARHGRLRNDLARAKVTASKLKGRVYETQGSGNVLVADFWVPPKPQTSTYRQRRAQQAEMALFGQLL
jgi:hypothetical protein